MTTRRALLVFAIMLCSAGVVMAQTEWTLHPDSPVIDPGAQGSWDDLVRAPLAVHFDGSVYHLWFMGNNSALEHGEIGHATSTDGVEWTMDPANPVLTLGEPGEWDDNWMFGAGLVHDGTLYHMWYLGRNEQTMVEQGGYATSPDGTVWTKHPDNPVLTPGPDGAWDDVAVDPKTVVFEDGVYRMWYGGFDGTIEQVGYAESTDGVNWTKHPDPVLEVGQYSGAWDGTRAANPFVIFEEDTYHMWYTGVGSAGWSIGYASSGDGIDWTKYRENWVLTGSEGITLNSPVYFDGETFHMWYGQVFNSDGTWRTMYATSDCCTALDHWKFIPAAAVASGAQGAFFQTDVDLSNADNRAVEYEFSWLPRGETNSEPVTSEVFTLGAGMSARYTNVLSEVFDLEPDSLGALLIKSSSADLLAMSRTYNLPSAEQTGTFGQAMPAVSDADFFLRSERRRLVFGTENADMRFNVGCQNANDSAVVVSFELFAADGISLGTDRLILRPYSNDQLNLIFDQYRPVDGCVDFWSETPMSQIYCYGSLLDNVTSDPTTIPPR